MVIEMVDGLANIEGISARRGFPTEPGIQPADVPRVYLPEKLSAPQLQDLLRRGNRACCPV